MSQDKLKEKAAGHALSYVKNNMKLGIGTGSTAECFIKLLGKEVANGLNIIGVPTSERTAALCKSLNIPLSTLDEYPELDLTIDGADEVDGKLRLVKGGGGALLREKIIASASKDMLVIVDESKLVDNLGAFPLPIEVNIFGLRATKIAVENLAAEFNLSGDVFLRNAEDTPFITDGGHYILDAHWQKLTDPEKLSQRLQEIPGVVDNGLFLNIATKVVVAKKDGSIEVIES